METPIEELNSLLSGLAGDARLDSESEIGAER
jgi:hypothetical protein